VATAERRRRSGGPAGPRAQRAARRLVGRLEGSEPGPRAEEAKRRGAARAPGRAQATAPHACGAERRRSPHRRGWRTSPPAVVTAERRRRSGGPAGPSARRAARRLVGRLEGSEPHVRDQLTDCVAGEGRLAWACCSGPGLRYEARRRGLPGRNLSHCLCPAPAGWGGPSSRTRSWGRWCWASEMQSALFVRVLVGVAVVSEKPLILVLKAAP